MNKFYLGDNPEILARWMLTASISSAPNLTRKDMLSVLQVMSCEYRTGAIEGSARLESYQCKFGQYGAFVGCQNRYLAHITTTIETSL